MAFIRFILIKLEFGTKSTETHVQLTRPKKGERRGEKERMDVSSWNGLSCVFILLPFLLRVFVLFVFSCCYLVKSRTQLKERKRRCICQAEN